MRRTAARKGVFSCSRAALFIIQNILHFVHAGLSLTLFAIVGGKVGPIMAGLIRLITRVADVKFRGSVGGDFSQLLEIKRKELTLSF